MVLFNKRLPASKQVADHYAQARKVPNSQVIGFDLSTDEAMSRSEFQTMLQRRLFDYLVLRGLFRLGPAEPTPGGGPPSQRVVT